MAKRNNSFDISAISNNATYTDYLNRVKKLATARFKWSNVPDSWNTNFLEQTLYYYGMCGALYDEQYGHMLTKTTINGKLNIYNMPIKLNCYGIYYNKTKYVYNGLDNTDKKDCVVLIQNDPEMIPTRYTVELFCRRLYEIERTIDVNLKQQKTPSLILCDQKQRLTLLNLYMQYDGNQPFIFGDKLILGNQNPIQAIDTKAPFLLDKLTAHKQSVWNELLTFLGVNNVNFEKKERLITEEANANNQFINLNIMNEYKCRKDACKQINEYFGLNVDVEFNTDIINMKNVEKIVGEVDKDE